MHYIYNIFIAMHCFPMGNQANKANKADFDNETKDDLILRMEVS